MQHLRRILALFFIFFGWKTTQSQPLPGTVSNPAPQPAASPNTSPAKTTPPPQDPNLPPLAFAMKEYKMSADQEAKARALLEQAFNSDKTRQAAAAPMIVPAQPVKTAPVAASAKADDEAAREREIARIEAEVLKAKQRREGQLPAAAPAPAAAPTVASTLTGAPTPLQQNAVTGLTPEQEAKARALLNSDRPENASASRDAVPASTSALKTNLTPDQEKKARSVLRTDFVVVGSDNPTPQTVPPSAGSALPAPTAVNPAGAPPTQLPAPVKSSAQPVAPAAVPPSASVTAPTPLPAPIQFAQSSPPPAAPAVVPTAPSAKPAPTAASAQVQGTLTPEKEAQARELLQQTSLGLGATGPAMKSGAAPVAAAPTIVPQTAAPVVAPVPATVYNETAPVNPAISNDQETKARQMLRGMFRDNRMDVVGTQPANSPAPAVTQPATRPVVTAAPTPAPAPAVVATAPAPVPVPAPQTAAAPVVDPAAPASAQKLQPVEFATTAPVGSVASMSADQEAKARGLLKQVTGHTTYSPSPVTTASTPTGTPAVPPVATPAPVTVATPPAVVVTPPPAAVITPPPAYTAATGTLTAEQEAKARELLLQLREQKPPATAVNPPAAAIAPTPAPITATPPTAIAVNPPPPTTPNIAPVAPPATVPGTALTPEQEAKARALLTEVSGNVFTPANHPAQPSDPKRAAQEAKVRAKAEAQARKEMDRMQEEAKVKARDEMRKKADAEARARKEAEETTAAIRSREKDELRKRNDADASLMARTRPADAVPAETKPVQPTTARANVGSSPASTPAPTRTALRPEDDPSVPLAKRQRLRQLLDDYMRDRITPSEYHTARAKILTEPQ